MTIGVERQVSWGAGEISPTLYGRTDLPYYRQGAKTLTNFLVTTHGVLKNRPGTQHIERLSGNFNVPKLVPYMFSESDAAVLALFDSRVRPWAASSVDPRFAFEYQRPGGTTSSIFGWPWTSDNGIASVRTAQLGKVVTFVGRGFQPQEITRTDDDWVRSLVDFSRLEVTDADFNFGIPGHPNQIPYAIPDPDTTLAMQTIAQNGDATHPRRPWVWVITYVLRDDVGNVFETAGYTVKYSGPGATGTVNARPAIYVDTPWQVRVRTVDHALYAPLGFEFVTARIYRGRDGVFGYIGELSQVSGASAGLKFVDEGNEPDLSNPPPVGVSPFHGSDNKPGYVTYHEGRRFFCATTNAPAKVWGSGVQRFTDFDEVVFADDSDALSFVLTTSRRNEFIRAMVSRGRLFLLTSAGVRMAAGSGDQEIITPNSIAARSVSEEGCANLDVVETPKAVWFAQASQATPRALVFGGDGSVQVMDPSLAALHLFEGFTIVDWAWAENPWKILYVVRSDGKLLSCTFEPELNVLAWATHDIADGEVVAVETIPEGTEDGVYLQVRRNGGSNYDLERLAKRLFTDIRHAVFLDRSITYNGLNTVSEDFELVTPTFTALSGQGYTPGETVVVQFGAAATAALSVQDSIAGRIIQWDDPEGGSPYRIQLTVQTNVTEYEGQILDRNVESGEDTGIPEAFQATEVEEWYLCTQSVSGLSHLDGLEVSAVADGRVITGLTVAGGGVDLGEQYGIVHVGRPYVSEFESLDCSTGDSNRDRQKVVKKAHIEMEHSRGGEVGGSLDGRMTGIRDSIDPTYTVEPVTHRREPVVVADTYDNHGRVALRQTQPMPITILGVTREVEYGGR